jgi:hypothetical protein
MTTIYNAHVEFTEIVFLEGGRLILIDISWSSHSDVVDTVRWHLRLGLGLSMSRHTRPTGIVLTNVNPGKSYSVILSMISMLATGSIAGKPLSCTICQAVIHVVARRGDYIAVPHRVNDYLFREYKALSPTALTIGS